MEIYPGQVAYLCKNYSCNIFKSILIHNHVNEREKRERERERECARLCVRVRVRVRVRERESRIDNVIQRPDLCYFEVNDSLRSNVTG